MLKKLIIATCLVLLASQAPAMAQALHAEGKSMPVIPFCQLVSQPEKYFGKSLTLNVRVGIYRHGTAISSPSCPNATLVLVATPSAQQNSSVPGFYEFLERHRQSRTSIFAIVTGHLVKGTTQGFMLQRDFDFALDSVSDYGTGIK